MGEKNLPHISKSLQPISASITISLKGKKGEVPKKGTKTNRFKKGGAHSQTEMKYSRGPRPTKIKGGGKGTMEGGSSTS